MKSFYLLGVHFYDDLKLCTWGR